MQLLSLSSTSLKFEGGDGDELTLECEVGRGTAEEDRSIELSVEDSRLKVGSDGLSLVFPFFEPSSYTIKTCWQTYELLFFPFMREWRSAICK